ncbi:MAG: DUF1326 domain-containing protein [Planctomycetes bacterium]|nr:DUF1326 domain-containing protein [Planctomycetota bacterium]
MSHAWKQLVSLFLLLLLFLLTPACASGGTVKVADSKVTDDWELVGWRVIGCCCAAPCPCRINKKPMNCHGCDHTDVVHVERGTLGGTQMDGVTWIVIGRGFGQDVEGNWVQVYVDEKASEAQVKAVGDMLAGTVEGWGSRAPYLAGKFLGIRETPMSVSVSSDRREYAASIPGVLEIKTRAIVNPGRRDPVVSTGIMDSFGDRFVHSDALVHTYSDPSIGHSWDLTGKQSNQADFVLNQKRVDEGHLGWGCWSAHASFDDDEPYGEEQVGHAHAATE